MTGMCFDKKKFDKSWHELGLRLKKIEQRDGLAKAIEELRRNQQELGFIKDDLTNLQRFYFTHPHDANRYFSIQYNPNRVKRFGGNHNPAPGAMEMHNNCVLCRDNIGWQQHGKELGYDFTLNTTPFTVLMNPYPLMPVHALVATREHISQAWNFNNDVADAFSIEKIINDTIDISCKLPGYVVFYNGINAGTSIPSHFHLHIIKRICNELRFPIELAPRQKTNNAQHKVLEYPVHAWYWQGKKQDIIQSAYNWIKDWLIKNNKIQNRLSANIITSLNNCSGDIEFYFIPRDQQRSSSSNMQGIIGGLEILGELVFFTDQEKTRLENGEVNYKQIAKILSSIHPHESIQI